MNACRGSFLRLPSCSPRAAPLADDGAGGRDISQRCRGPEEDAYWQRSSVRKDDDMLRAMPRGVLKTGKVVRRMRAVVVCFRLANSGSGSKKPGGGGESRTLVTRKIEMRLTARLVTRGSHNFGSGKFGAVACTGAQHFPPLAGKFRNSGIPVCAAIVVVTGTSACGWTQEHPRRRRRDHTRRLTSPRTLVGPSTEPAIATCHAKEDMILLW
jgi:hypothetical protein